ncbi:succinyl transferase OpgC [Nitrogeniibacter mangrovi]|uniref:Succinyl transferase OpgC n=1 Tax=Nitrogeniibacter mangrovi TaxID=2016596 RepID=A0A6C1B3P4_9RHOO|nr:OpgC domain-containing protein [Nitrogeniibacter mangrovi]QID17475.1 succinyl transferase OpgC [Nitrogeniibacter mangrovi]
MHAPASPSTTRLWQLDALRGLMLVLMTLTHVPTRLTQPMGQPFGFVSAAFGFVFLSALLVGRVHGRRLITAGAAPVRRALWQRAGVVYACHLALLLTLFGILPHTGVVPEKGPLPGMLWYFHADPTAAVLGAVGLLHQPGLLDILPMYVVFLLVSPALLIQGARGGWPWMLAFSIGLWLAAQFGLGGPAYDRLASTTGIPVPRGALGAFDLLAWQLVWTGGLAFGWALAHGWQPRPARWPRALVATAALVALTGLIWRHGVGQIPFPAAEQLNWLFDKWHMGPLRLLNATALLILVMRFGPRHNHPPRLLAPLQRLGQAALPVFCAHAVVAMLVLGLAGDEIRNRPPWVDLVILIVTFATLFTVAELAHRRRSGALRRGARTCASTA